VKAKNRRPCDFCDFSQTHEKSQISQLRENLGISAELWAWEFIAVRSNVTWFNIVTKEYIQTALKKVTQGKLAVRSAWYGNAKKKTNKKEKKIGNVFPNQKQSHKPLGVKGKKKYK